MAKMNPVDVVRVEEPWAEATLADGTKIKAKVVFDRVSRCEGEFLPDGHPLYQVGTQLVVSVSAPESMRKKP